MVARLSRDDELPTKIPAHRAGSALHVSLAEYQAENALLGRLLQDSQARCDQTGKRLTAAKRRAADAERQQEFMSKRLEQGASVLVMPRIEQSAEPARMAPHSTEPSCTLVGPLSVRTARAPLVLTELTGRPLQPLRTPRRAQKTPNGCGGSPSRTPRPSAGTARGSSSSRTPSWP